MNKSIGISIISITLACGLGVALLNKDTIQNVLSPESSKPGTVVATPDASPTPTELSETASFFSISEGIRIEYPRTWVKTESSKVFLLLSSVNAPDVSISLEITDLTENPLTLVEFNDQHIAALKKTEQKMYILEEGFTTFAGLQSYKIVYTFDGTEQLSRLQVWTIRDNKAYLVTYTAQEKNYASFFLDFEKISSTLLFTK
jgi:hypothetical protein